MNAILPHGIIISCMLLFIMAEKGISSTETCVFVLREKKGSIMVNNLVDVCIPHIRYILAMPGNLLYLNVRITTQFESKNCDQAIDLVVLPDETSHCYKENFCKIFFRKGLNTSHLSSWYKTYVSRSICNSTWISVPDEEWPPEVGVKQRSPFFVAEVDYEFFDVSDKKGRRKDEEKTVMRQGSSQVITVTLTVGGCCLLLLVVGLLLYRYKLQRQLQTDVENDIAPYAIHVSVRRRSENASTAFNTAVNIRNHYDLPTPGDPESEYLHPMRECPYYEIDGDGRPIQITDFDNRSDSFNDDDDDIYDMAESNETRENVTNLNTFPSKSSDCENIIKINQFSGYANLPTELSTLAPKNLSVRSFSESALHLLGETCNSSKVEYGEIIGTVGRHGSLTRFEPCRDIYKSIRKKK